MSKLENIVEPRPLTLRDIRPGWGLARTIYRSYKGKVAPITDDGSITAGITIALVDSASFVATMGLFSYLFNYY